MELVVTIVIAVILAALAIPRLRQTETDATWFQEQAKAAVRYAQRQAVAQRRCVWVRVTATQIDLLYGTGTNGCAAADPASPLIQLATGTAYAIQAPGGVALGAAPSTFSFDALGVPSAAATLTIGPHSIQVTATTGYVRNL